jgi:hypothetical protein
VKFDATTTAADHFPGRAEYRNKNKMHHSLRCKPCSCVGVELNAILRRGEQRLPRPSPRCSTFVCCVERQPMTRRAAFTLRYRSPTGIVKLAVSAGHAISAAAPVVSRPYTPAAVRFEGTTTAADHYPAHHVEAVRPTATAAFSPSACKFDATTTSRTAYPAHPVSPSRGGEHVAPPGGRGLHSSTFRLNLCAFRGIGGAFRGCLGGV